MSNTYIFSIHTCSHDIVEVPGTDMSVEQGLLTISYDGTCVVHFAPGEWRHARRFERDASPTRQQS